MFARLRYTISFLSALALFACSEQRPLYPVAAAEPLVHEPWEDQEAEDIACMVSGDVTAPLPLYKKVKSDLALIREVWGDSISRIRTTKAIAPYLVPEFGLKFDTDAFSDITNGRYAEWDSLIQQYRMSVSLSDEYIYVSTEIRLNKWRMYQSFERLRGFRSIWQSYFRLDGPRLYAHMVDDEVRFLLRDAWGDCPAGCIVSQYHYFAVEDDSVHYYGSWRSYPPGEAPTWWIVAKQAEILWREGDPEYRFRDASTPESVSDLQATGLQFDRSLTVEFTAPGDLGLTGDPSAYVFRWGPDSVSEANWYQLPYASFPAKPEGTRVSVTIKNLPAHGVNVIGMRSVDKLENWSRVSNTVRTQNVLDLGWTNINSSNSPLKDNDVSAMLTDVDGRLWIGSRTGISAVDAGSWQTFGVADHSIFDQQVTTISQDRTGRVWVGTPAGAASFDGAGWTTQWPADPTIQDTEVRCINSSHDGSVWLGIGFSGVVHYNGEYWTRHDSSNSGIRGNIVRKIVETIDGSVWFGGNKGLSQYKTGIWTKWGPDRSVTSILQLPDATMLVGTHEGFLYHFRSPTDWDVFEMKPYESWPRQSRAITELVNAGAESIWLITYGSVRRYTVESVTESLVLLPSNSGLPEREISALAAGEADLLWIGTRNSGVCRWDLSQSGLGNVPSTSNSSEL